jgi:hypothetical protein
VLLGPTLTWYFVHHRTGWKTAEVLAAMSMAVSITAALAAPLDRRLGRRPAERDIPVPKELGQADLEAWRASVRSAVVESRVDGGGQLDQMVPYGDALDMDVRLIDRDSRKPRLSVDGKLRAWSEIKEEWDKSSGRLVILGDPGYGKTVAALTLIAHINAREAAGASIAELFSLADWHLWQAGRTDAHLHDWLAEQLTLTYSDDLPLEVSRQLIAKGLILPILDGLDEIPTVDQRRACIDAIDAYTRRTAPHRPFVLTCRADEYAELAPDWVSAEHHVVLAGLQPDQIDALIGERTTGRPGWDAIRVRHARGDAALGELLRNPLYMTIALHAYRDRDPSELLGLSVEEARCRLWELLLSDGVGTFQGASPDQVRRWLEFLAAGLRRTARQRFMLHELYLLDPDSAVKRKSFVVIAGLSLTLFAALIFWQFSGLLDTLILGPIYGMAIAVYLASYATLPATRERVGWKVRVRYATDRVNLLVTLALTVFGGLIALLVIALPLGLTAGVIVGLFCAFLSALISISFDIVFAGTRRVTTEPPGRFAHKGPAAVLVASRNSGLISGPVLALPLGLVIGLILAWAGGLMLGLLSGLAFALLVGLGFGLGMGLGAWLFHYQLRWQLYKHGLLPRRLQRFLSWCAHPSRGWLRMTNAYEFRHRELLDHLALAPSGGTGRKAGE